MAENTMQSSGIDFGKRYEGIEEIGRGGMGLVYKAHDTVREKELALKEMSGKHIDSTSALIRFRNEFRIMSEFKHPNTVEVFDYGTTSGGVPYITMEYITGKTIDLLEDLSIGQVVDLLIQICRAIGYIHSRLYIHRDLKPGNIKLREDGSIKLLDYGLMSQLGLPASGKLSGTVYYMAPEVITGGIIDESTDLYSLGIIGYELLTGRRPFTGSKKEILREHLRTRPEPPSIIRPDIPAALDDIIMKLLEKSKDGRYRNTAEALEDLQYLAGGSESIETVEQKQGYLYSSKMIGRDREMDIFREKLDDLEQGRGGAVFAGAPAGLGKTRLLNEMKTIAELEGFETLFFTSRHMGEKNYDLVDGLVHQLIPISDEETIEEFGSPLSPICHGLAGSFPGEALKLDETSIVSSLGGWISRLSRQRSLVIFIDDAQWLDLNSIKVLNGLLRSAGDSRILIITGFRNNEVDKTSPFWHTVEEGTTLFLPLSPLNMTRTGELMENLLYPTKISDEFLSFCYHNSGGNVFDLMEFLRHLIAEGYLTRAGNRWTEPVNPESISLPGSMEERLLKRIGKLGEEARIMAEAVSVLENYLDMENWQAVTGYDLEPFFQGIDDLLAGQVIVRSDGSYRFSHDKIRSTLYGSIPPGRRARFHHKAAEFMAANDLAKNTGLLPIIATHYVEAGDDIKAIDFSLKAARAAEEGNAEWQAFTRYREAARLLEKNIEYPDRDALLLEIYEKAARFSSAAWGDAPTCLKWLEKAIQYHAEKGDMEKVFNLSLSYIVTSAITSNYDKARSKIKEIIKVSKIRNGTLTWAVLFGAGVCLVDWYQGFQQDCFDHAVEAIRIFESQLDTLPGEAWPCYSWALFWRDKARAYTGVPIVTANIEKIRQLMEEGKSDLTIYWHTLTAVGARAAFTGRYSDMMEWKRLAAQLSRKMGKIYWFECWISHSYLYSALDYGDFSQLESHIERVQASPDPYQVRLAYLFRGRLRLVQKRYKEAEANFLKFFEMEKKSPDNSLPEGLIFLARTYLETGRINEARILIDRGAGMAASGKYENSLYKLIFCRLEADLAGATGLMQMVPPLLERALLLAEEMDNPLQQAFIHKTRGEFFLQSEEYEKAGRELENAVELFFSLGNKYQAGLVNPLLDSVNRKVKSGFSGEITAMKREPLEGTLEDYEESGTVEEMGTVLEDTVTIRRAKSGMDTDLEGTGLEKTDQE